MANAIDNIWISAPSFELPESAVGPTDYIDRLPAKALSEKVMKGIDQHGRKFVALRCEAETVDYGYGSENHPFTVVVFERYSERSGFWVLCGDFGPCGVLDDEKMGFVKKLIDGVTVDFEEDFSCSIELK